MGGQIGLDSKEGEGTCAWFSVPFKKAREDIDSLSLDAPAFGGRAESPTACTPCEPNAPSLPPLAPTSSVLSLSIGNENGLLGSNIVNGMSPRPSGSLQRPRKGIWILVAEDNRINQQIALKTLRKMHFNAEAVDNGKQVLAAMELRTYDLILMDCQVSTTCLVQMNSNEP